MIEIVDTRIGMLRRGMPLVGINPVRDTLKVSVRPKPVTGKNWEQPFAANAENLEAAVRDAQTIFAPGTSGSECIAASGYVLLSFRTRPKADHPSCICFPSRPVICIPLSIIRRSAVFGLIKHNGRLPREGE